MSYPPWSFRPIAPLPGLGSERRPRKEQSVGTRQERKLLCALRNAFSSSTPRKALFGNLNRLGTIRPSFEWAVAIIVTTTGNILASFSAYYNGFQNETPVLGFPPGNTHSRAVLDP